MGKNRDRESLIRVIVNTVVHRIVLKNTNRPESKKSLNAEVIEYRGLTEKSVSSHSWNKDDIKYIKTKSLKKIKEKLDSKYSDISYNKKDPEEILQKEINEIGI